MQALFDFAMRILDPLFKRWPWLREFTVFCIIGCINAAVHFVFFMALVQLLTYQSISNMLGFFAGVCCSFYLNSRFTFKARPTLGRFIRMVIAMSSLAFAFGLAGDLLHMHPVLTFVIYVTSCPVISFLLTKFFVFGKGANDAAGKAEADNASAAEK